MDLAACIVLPVLHDALILNGDIWASYHALACAHKNTNLAMMVAGWGLALQAIRPLCTRYPIPPWILKRLYPASVTYQLHRSGVRCDTIA